MTPEPKTNTIETSNPIARRIREWEGMRTHASIHPLGIFFQSPERPGSGMEIPVNTAQIYCEVPEGQEDCGKTPIAAAISMDRRYLGTSGNIQVQIFSSINQLSNEQRAAVYGLVASCCRPHEKPLVEWREEVLPQVREELNRFLQILYEQPDPMYDLAEQIRERSMHSDPTDIL